MSIDLTVFRSCLTPLISVRMKGEPLSRWRWKVSKARKQLPNYLQEYLTIQDYDGYSARDHATWRCIMRQGRDIFGKTAHPIYLQGLKETGIPMTRIPKVDEMDALLALSHPRNGVITSNWPQKSYRYTTIL